MLSYALAIAVAISSLALFATAFFMSDIHRQDDFLWSGIGLFYASILWFCARNITGTVLLGQAAATTLLVSYSWQTLKLRKAVAHPEKAAEINNFSVLRSVTKLLKGEKTQAPAPVTTPIDAANKKVTKEVVIPEPNSSQPNLDSHQQQSEEVKEGVSDRQINTTDTEDNAISEDKPQAESEKESEASTPSVVSTDESAKPTTEVEQSIADTQEAAETEVKETKSLEAQDRVEIQETEQKTKIQLSETNSDAGDTAPDLEIEEKVEVANLVEGDNSSKPEVEAVEKEEKKETEEITESQSPEVETATEPETEIVSENSVASQETESEDISQAEKPVTIADVGTKMIDEPSEAKSADRADVLDSLETVEVAEVLEASPDDSYGDRNLDKSNIIEVTTTDIDIKKDVKNIDSDKNMS